MFYSFALLEKMSSEVVMAYIAFRRQVELTYFMSISLFAMGILSRIQYLIKDLMDKILDAYKLLKPSTSKLPNILSLEGFNSWNSKKDQVESQVIQNDYSSSDNEERKITVAENPSLSDEFWSRSESVQKKKRKHQDVPKSLKKIKPQKKASNELDMIFGLLD